VTGRSKRGVTLWLLLAAACDCGQSHSAPDGSVDATSPEPDGGRVVAEGCDDPELWAVSPTEELELTVGSGPCAPAQYPLFASGVAFPGITTDHTSCWRVASADPRSGLVEGSVTHSDTYFLSVSLVGFDRPVAMEGRLVAPDGTVVRAGITEPTVLEPERVQPIEVDGLLGVAEGGAVVRRTQDSVERPWPEGALAVAFTASRPWLVLEGRLWTLDDDDALVDLGSHEGPVIADPRSPVIAVDDEIRAVDVYAGPDSLIRWSVSIEGSIRQLESAGIGDTQWAANDERLYRIREGGTVVDSVPIGGGRLVPVAVENARYRRKVHYWDGEQLRRLPVEGPLLGDPVMTLDPELGAPLAAMDGLLLAERGFALVSGASIWGSARHIGATSVALADVFPEALEITHVSSDLWWYVVLHDDGTSTLHRAPHGGFCGP